MWIDDTTCFPLKAFACISKNKRIRQDYDIAHVKNLLLEQLIAMHSQFCYHSGYEVSCRHNVWYIPVEQIKNEEEGALFDD